MSCNNTAKDAIMQGFADPKEDLSGMFHQQVSGQKPAHAIKVCMYANVYDMDMSGFPIKHD